MDSYFKRLSIRKQVIVLISTILIILLTSFLVTGYSARKVIQQKTADANLKMVQQVQDRVTAFSIDMENIAYSLFYSPTILNYLEITDRSEQILMYKEMINVCSNTISLKDGIAGVMLFNRYMEYSGSSGVYIDPEEIPKEASNTVYSSLVYSPMNNMPMYLITFPIWDLKSEQVGKQIGLGVFVMECESLRPLLNNSLVTDNTKMMLLDQSNNLLVGEGVSENDRAKRYQYDEAKNQITDLYIDITGWQLVNIVPQNELLPEISLVQRYNVIAYAMTAGLLALFVVCIFHGIIRPIHKITAFAKKFPEEMNDDRLQIRYKNEIGDLAKNLNQMLDEINSKELENRNAQKHMYEMELDKKQSEIISYRNQINPHFLYNTLECISGMAAFYQAPQIAEISEALSNLYRYAVKGKDLVTVYDEISYIQEYAKIIDYRFMGKIKVNIEAERQTFTCTIIKMLLQPLVENAVFHGLEKKIENGSVDISIIVVKEDFLKVEIKDNGIGIEKETVESLIRALKENENSNQAAGSLGIGISNVYHRLRLFYGDRASFDLESKSGEGANVTLEFPCSLLREEKYV